MITVPGTVQYGYDIILFHFLKTHMHTNPPKKMNLQKMENNIRRESTNKIIILSLKHPYLYHFSMKH